MRFEQVAVGHRYLCTKKGREFVGKVVAKEKPKGDWAKGVFTVLEEDGPEGQPVTHTLYSPSIVDLWSDGPVNAANGAHGAAAAAPEPRAARPQLDLASPLEVWMGPDVAALVNVQVDGSRIFIRKA